MSYDIQIWSIDPICPSSGLLDADKWHQKGDSWAFVTRNWQIVLNASAQVLLEDIPPDTASMLPGINFMTELNLEPISAPKSARRLLLTITRRLARAAHGVILNPQADTITSPKGVKRYRPEPRDERFSLLTLSWWFTDGPLLTNVGLVKFVDMLERMLPEAMPRRYGLTEPPQHLYSETGKEHLLTFLREYLDDIVVWYPHRPVVGVSIFGSHKWGMTQQGFRANYVTVKVEAKALEQPGWCAALDRLWRVASQNIRPFYGDIRTLNGFVRMGGTYGSDMNSDFHPVKGPWWSGIPRACGHAAVLGEPYRDLWPSFVKAAQIEDGLAFLSTDDWTKDNELSDLVGGVPDAIAQLWTPIWAESPFGGKAINWSIEPPPEFPFGDTGGA
jgi:hypothetical protein